jgi:cytochrome c oxidase subunit 3
MPAPRLAEQFEDLAKQADAARLGMWVFLGSEMLLFGGLFALYAAYRAMYPADFAEAVALNNVGLGTTNTVILITSSLTVALGVGAVRTSQPRRAALLFALTFTFGAVFLALKGAEYAQHFREGIYPGLGYHHAELGSGGAVMFFTLYYVMTGLHALHVTAGMLVLGWLGWGCWRARYSAENPLHVELGGLYWHLVDIVWIFLWPMLYLMHR